MASSDRQLVRSLKKPAGERNSKDVDTILHFLTHSTDSGTNTTGTLLCGLNHEEARQLASRARFEWRDADELVFSPEDDADSACFVLIAGLVYFDNRLAYPGAVIRAGRGGGRLTEVLVLEPSEFLAVELVRRVMSPVRPPTSESQRLRQQSGGGLLTTPSGRGTEPSWHPLNRQPFMILSDPFLEESSVDVDTNEQAVDVPSQESSPVVATAESKSKPAPSSSPSSAVERMTQPQQSLHQQFFQKRPLSDDTSSVSSFASSSMAPTGLRRGSSTQQGSSLTVDDIDLTGLTESAVDSDDDLLSPNEDNSSSDISDVYRECLEKHPGQRTEHDIDLLVDFVQNFPAFANLTQNEKRSLCQVMTYAVVEEAGAVIVSDGDDVDSWSVIINGALEHRLADNSIRELGVGESFGVESTREKPRRHSGVLRTLVPYCQFIVVSHTDYVSVLSRAEQDKQVVREKGHVVLVMEERDFVFQHGQAQFATFPRGSSQPSGGSNQQPGTRSKRVPVVIRGTAERLIELVVPNSPTQQNQQQQNPAEVAQMASSTDPTFSEDFLVTFPLFLDSVAPICNFLLTALLDASSPARQKKAANVITHWVSADFGLFERVRELGDFLETVENVLEEMALIPQLKLLLLATHSRSRPRNVVITKQAATSSTSQQQAASNNNSTHQQSMNLTNSPAAAATQQQQSSQTAAGAQLPPRPPQSGGGNFQEAAGFQITGGLEQRAGIFVSSVQRNSAAWRAGLRRGDQILHVNNHDLTSVTYNRALDVLQATSHLALTVKYNKLGLQSLSGLAHLSGSSPSARPSHRPSLPSSRLQSVTATTPIDSNSIMKHSSTAHNVRSASSADTAAQKSHGTRFSRLVAKVSKKLGGGHQHQKHHVPPSISVINEATAAEEHAKSQPLVPTGQMTRSRSNPDLISGILPKRSPFPDPPDQAVLVYTPEQEHRYFLVRSDTTATDLIGMAVREFNLANRDPSHRGDPLANYALFEVTIHPTTASVRTRRLLDDRSDLAERLPVCGRYYLRQMTSSSSSATLVGPQEAGEMTGELGKIQLLAMRPRLVALVLTLAEFEAFEQIQPLDYIDDVLALTDSHNTRPALLSGGGGHARVEAMTSLSNRQLFWVVTEIAGEPKLRRRVQLIQFFVKLAGFCLRLNNFESTFAIVAGLGHSAVVRLNATWARVSPKYKKLLEDYRELFDPSRNMSRYRNHIARLQREGRLCPAVPLFPLVKKDLAFVHLGNSTFVAENDADPNSGATLINVEKLRMLGREVRHIRHLCAERYPGKELFDQVYFGTGADSGQKGVVAGIGSGWLTLGRRKGNALSRVGGGSGIGLGGSGSSDSNAALNAGPKQIFWAMRTRKQIEFYLNSRLNFPPSRTFVGEAVPIVDETAYVCIDERQLMSMSRQCEPDLPPAQPAPGVGVGIGSIGNKAATLFMTPPPPAGPVAPKFGTAEGQNISKMMSLCKEVKPHTEKMGGKPGSTALMTAVSHSPAPPVAPMAMRSPTTGGHRIPRNLIYQYVLQQQMTDVQAELRRRPIARLSSESSSVVPASLLRSPGAYSTHSRSYSSTSSGTGHF